MSQITASTPRPFHEALPVFVVRTSTAFQRLNFIISKIVNSHHIPLILSFFGGCVLCRSKHTPGMKVRFEERGGSTGTGGLCSFVPSRNKWHVGKVQLDVVRRTNSRGETRQDC
eukprot:scaffold59941_cov46-Cyclotella_meneghiniana.AAC.3